MQIALLLRGLQFIFLYYLVVVVSRKCKVFFEGYKTPTFSRTPKPAVAPAKAGLSRHSFSDGGSRCRVLLVRFILDDKLHLSLMAQP
jgi:hypothetical protein